MPTKNEYAPKIYYGETRLGEPISFNGIATYTDTDEVCASDKFVDAVDSIRYAQDVWQKMRKEYLGFGINDIVEFKYGPGIHWKVVGYDRINGKRKNYTLESVLSGYKMYKVDPTSLVYAKIRHQDGYTTDGRVLVDECHCTYTCGDPVYVDGHPGVWFIAKVHRELYETCYDVTSIGRDITIEYVYPERIRPVNKKDDVNMNWIKKEEINMKSNKIEIVKVIYNNPATIVFWSDKTKTVVKCGKNDVYDPEKGLVMAYFKKMHGNEGNYYNLIKKHLPKPEDMEVGGDK